jgi:hypothetical protein
MKSVLCCFSLFAAGLWGRSTAKLDADLTALANPGASQSAITQQMADDILALADKDAQPSRQTVVDFAYALTRAFFPPVERARQRVIIWPPGNQPTLQAVSQAIVDVLHSSSMTSSQFHASIDRFRTSLSVLVAPPAQAKSAADRLLILGQEVRGPEDIGAK